MVPIKALGYQRRKITQNCTKQAGNRNRLLSIHHALCLSLVYCVAKTTLRDIYKKFKSLVHYIIIIYVLANNDCSSTDNNTEKRTLSFQNSTNILISAHRVYQKTIAGNIVEQINS